MNDIAIIEIIINNEPSDWHYPVRQSLGAVLLSAEKYVMAEQIYKQDLITFPDNGWSLYGLMKALEMKDKNIQAEIVEKRFNKSWQWADIKLDASPVL